MKTSDLSQMENTIQYIVYGKTCHNFQWKENTSLEATCKTDLEEGTK